jgi:nucleoside-diphosphate-sugar epimerase
MARRPLPEQPVPVEPDDLPLTGGVVLALAGVTGGSAEALRGNVTLSLAACDLARRQGARHVFLCSSAAVYGRGQGQDLAEDAVLAPANDYGRAKCEMEAAARAWQAQRPVGGPGLTLLRIGNVAGFDALLGQAVPGREVTLDPIAGQAGGPERSYIGPVTLARVLGDLCGLAVRGAALPEVVNVCAAPPVRMADLLEAAGLAWRHGPENPAAIARVALDNRRLAGLVALPDTAGSVAQMVAEWRSLAEGQG